MIGLATLLFASAFAAELHQVFEWEISYEGRPVGRRTMDLQTEDLPTGTRRVLLVETSVDGSDVGLPYSFEQRMTALSSESPAAFHSVVNDNGEPREIQGRVTPMGWTVSVVDRGRARSWDLDVDRIDLSTVDLFDPFTHVPLSRIDHARVLSVETGDIWEADVRRLDPRNIVIDGQKIPVVGLAIDPPQGEARFFFSSEGYLVRYEYAWMGRHLAAQLVAPPPRGVDEVPLAMPGDGIEEVEL